MGDVRLPGRRLARACRAYAGAHLAVLGIICATVLSCGAALAAIRPPAEPLELLYGIRAIARYLGLSRRQAWGLVRSGAVPSFDLAGVRCARKASIAAHLARLEAAGRRDLDNETNRL